MIHPRRLSFTWPFCLSFACILSWFVPMQALFAVPAPPDGELPTFAQAPAPDLTPWIRDYETVFGTYTDGQDVFMHSAAPWDGSSIHLLVTDVGPCLYVSSTEIDITADVQAELPDGTAQYISTMGWLSGPEGVFPAGFAVISDGAQSKFIFTGLVPASILSTSWFDPSDGTELPEPSVLCTEGINALDAADAELDSMLAEEDGSKAAAALRSLLSDHTDQVRACWDAFVYDMLHIEQERALAISTAREAYDLDVREAKNDFESDMAEARAISIVCVIAACLAPPPADIVAWLACLSNLAISEDACRESYREACKIAKERFDLACEAANEQYRLDAIPIKHALEKCLGAINDQFANEACLYVTLLTFEGRLAIDQHQNAYQALGAEHGGCFEELGGVERLSHGLHIAVATCGFE